jgi:hypothetical protein
MCRSTAFRGLAGLRAAAGGAWARKKLVVVRDEMVQEALRRLAAEAATRFSSLVATGEELPFDVLENQGEHVFYRYVPLTSRFVREHAGELRSLPAFGPACSAVDQAGVAAPYLEARGEDVPADEIERAEHALVAFIARLWDGCAEFTLESTRLEAALRELKAEVRDISEAELLLAPLVGLQMSLPKLELPGGISIVRVDTVDAPAEATRSDGMNRSAWEPQFLALAEKEEGPGSTAPALRMLRELVSVMRLFKEGGVGLGPHAFTPTGEGWKKVATGVPATRPGGYKLSETEAGELAEFARQLEARPDPDGSLAWAVDRFEMGCDRPIALEGLSDQLLAMRALFEGSGPIGASLPMRAAALIAEPPEREEACEKLQGAFELERAMMAGREFDLGSATGLAAWLEDAARTVVRGAALGEHGSDIAASADESLVAAGLAAGEGSAEQMGELEEWDPEVADEPVGDPHAYKSVFDGFEPRVPIEELRIKAAEPAVEEPEPNDDEPNEAHEPDLEPETTESAYEDGVYYEEPEGQIEGERGDSQGDDHNDDEERTVRTSAQHDWLSEVTDAEEGETLEWPVPVREAKEEGSWREELEDAEPPLETPRVRHLFPVPDDTEWEVAELDYDRSETRVS